LETGVAKSSSGIKVAGSQNQTIHNVNKMKGHMKITYSILGLAAGAALFLANGCGKQEQPSGETPKAMNPPAIDTQKAVEVQPPPAQPAPVATAAATDAQKAAIEPTPPPAPTAAEESIKAAARQTEAAAAAAAAPSAADPQAQGLIDQAKSLVTSEKFQEALPMVQQLAGKVLTPEQQKTVDGLTAQIQAALAKKAAADAASSLGNPLGGK